MTPKCHGIMGMMTCPTCEGSGELYGNYSAVDAMELCFKCRGTGEVDLEIDTNPYQTTQIQSLVQAIYDYPLEDEQLDPARLAVLSDALEEAGLEDENILAHLRLPTPHTRHCWAVDFFKKEVDVFKKN